MALLLAEKGQTVSSSSLALAVAAFSSSHGLSARLSSSIVSDLMKAADRRTTFKPSPKLVMRSGSTFVFVSVYHYFALDEWSKVLELFSRTSCPKLTRGAFAVIVSWVACLRISELAELLWKDINTSEGVMEVC